MKHFIAWLNCITSTAASIVLNHFDRFNCIKSFDYSVSISLVCKLQNQWHRKVFDWKRKKSKSIWECDWALDWPLKIRWNVLMSSLFLRKILILHSFAQQFDSFSFFFDFKSYFPPHFKCKAFDWSAHQFDWLNRNQRNRNCANTQVLCAPIDKTSWTWFWFQRVRTTHTRTHSSAPWD